MKKILYIWKGPYPWDVRVEKFCKSLSSSGFNVLLLSRWNGEELEVEEMNSFTIKRVGFRKPTFFSTPLSINPLWRTAISENIELFNPQLIITREFFLTEAAKIIGRKRNIPVIFDMAEHYPAAIKGWDKYSKNIFKRIATHNLKIPEYLETKAVNSSDGIITVSQELSDRLVNKFNYPINQIAEVLNTPELESGTYPLKKSNSDLIRFGYHGHFTNDRNLDIFTEAFLIAAGQNPKISLFMAGDGESFGRVKDIVQSSTNMSKVNLFGKYDQSQMNQFLLDTDIGVLPYKSNEFINHIISNKLFDYMAAGIPVLVSDAKPMRRLVNNLGIGVSVDCSDKFKLSDAILDFADKDLSRYSENSIRHSVNRYNWEYDAKNLVNFIERYI